MKNSNFITAAAVCVGVLAPLSAHAQIKKQGAGYLLRMKYKPGAVRKYAIVTSISGLPAGQGGASGGPMKMTATLEQKILSVTGKVAKMEIKSSAFQMSNGASIGQPQTVTASVDEFGNTADGTETKDYGVHFPKDPVKVGGTWSRTSDLPAGMGGGASKATTIYKFNGIKRVGKVNVADVSFNVQGSGMLKGGSGHSYLNPADGSLSSVALKLSIANPQGGSDLVTTINVQPVK